MAELNVGGHLSLDRNPETTVEWAAEHGFTSMQIFASSPGAWKPPIRDEERAARFREARARYSVQPLVIHSIYLINLASRDETLVRRSISSLIATMEAGAAFGASAVITHIGSHAGRGFEAVAEDVARNIRTVLESAPESIDLALENSAGAGGIIGSTLEELGTLVVLAGRPPRLRVTLDTAHLCGAGWDFTQEGEAARLVSETERLIGLDRLAAIHSNDSKVPAGSRRDRHANIGEGYIALEGFRALLAQDELKHLPWILETPDLERRVDDLATLRALAAGSIPTLEPIHAT